MSSLPFKSLLAAVSGLCVSTFFAATPASAAPPPSANSAKSDAAKERSKFIFNILPKSLQKNPVLAMSVITEMTDEGRKMKVPSAENPVYYYLQSQGFHMEGSGADESKKVSQDIIERQMKQALAAAHYLEGTKDHPPTLVFFYVWGSHNKLLQPTEVGGDDGWEDTGNRNLLSRAQLVGGAAFAKDLAKALQQQADSGGAMTGTIADPVYRFTNRDDRTRELMEQTLDDCYYVVVSAYEGAALARNERKLLWRTKMTTAAQGVSLAETTPALISSGASFFGEDMKEPSLVDKRITRGGHVELGAPKVEEMTDKPISEMEKSRNEKK